MKPRRRDLLTIGAAAGTSGAVGIGLGHRYHRAIDAQVGAFSPDGGGPVADFTRRSREIEERHSRQTVEHVRSLKAKYESPILGRYRVWELIERLGLCIDPSDSSLLCTSQYMHVCQIVSAMEADGVKDDKLYLIALLHDLGKIAMLGGEEPEDVVCYIAPLDGVKGAGLDNAVFQFGHDEIAYSRFKDHVDEDVAWVLRYHSMVLGWAEPFMDASDRQREANLLQTFRMYDQGTKSAANRPQHMTLDRYRDFIEERFPNPILF